jgi:hypothetical protein
MISHQKMANLDFNVPNNIMKGLRVATWMHLASLINITNFIDLILPSLILLI